MSGNGGGGRRRSRSGGPDASPPTPRVKPGSGGGGGGGEEGSNSCDILIDTDLEGVRQSALTGLNVGSVLSVVLLTTAAFPTVVCVKPDQTVVGSLAGFRYLNDLIDCLKQGVDYRVEVTAIGPGSCHVRGGRV